MRKLLSRFRYHLLVFFAVIGPGFITAVVDEDGRLAGVITADDIISVLRNR